MDDSTSFHSVQHSVLARRKFFQYTTGHGRHGLALFYYIYDQNSKEQLTLHTGGKKFLQIALDSPSFQCPSGNIYQDSPVPVHLQSLLDLASLGNTEELGAKCPGFLGE